jgi:hypothetical protein
MKDENLLKIAVSKDFSSLCAIPKEKQTKELAYLAVDQDPKALLYLHSSLWTTNLLKRIVKNTPQGILQIPLSFTKESVFNYALKIHGEDVLKELNDPDINLILQKHGIEINKVETTHLDLLSQIKETYFSTSPTRKP